MKYLNKIALIVMLLSGISTSAQITQIKFNPFQEYDAKIKVEDNQLFVITPVGVYSQELDESGNLIGETLLQSEVFKNFEYKVVDFLKSGESIIAITGNSIYEGNAVFKSIDNGLTWIDISDKFDKSEYTEMNICQCYNSKDNIYFNIGSKIYYSSDFGENFESTSKEFCIDFLGCHNFNPLTLIYAAYMNTEEYVASVSFDAGKSAASDYGGEYYASDLDNFLGFGDIAFHYSSPNKIVIAGDKIVYSEDGGKTWEEKARGLSISILYENFLGQTIFDKRGSDRLYSQLISYSEGNTNQFYYSDDFGATWAELCEIGLAEDDYVADFVQHGNKIYTYSKNYKVHEIDLELLESAIEEVPADASDVAVSIANGTLQVVSQSQVSAIEVFNIGGVKMLSAESIDNVDISDLAKGTYVARIATFNGKTISRKFNK